MKNSIILLVLCLNCSRFPAQDSTLVRYIIHHDTGSSTVKSMYAKDLPVPGSPCISFGEACRIMSEKDTSFLKNPIKFEFVSYEPTDHFLWKFESSEIISQTALKRGNGVKRVSKTRYLWIDQNGKIDWYKRERQVFRGIIDF